MTKFQKVATALALMTASSMSFATVDYASLTSGITYDAVITAVLSVAVLIGARDVVFSGVNRILHFLRR